jgi:hypothetical protein
MRKERKKKAFCGRHSELKYLEDLLRFKIETEPSNYCKNC